MSNSLNKVMLIGHLGDEIKMHYFDGGNCLGRFPIATNENYKNKTTGEQITTTEWHNIVVRSRLAENCERFLSKGDRVYIEGRLKTRNWQDESGNKHYTTEVHAYDVMFLKTKKDIGEIIQASKNENTPNTTSKEIKKEDDLPF